MKNDYYIAPEDYEEAEKRGISKQVLYQRVYIYNWSKERAMNTPLRRQHALPKELIQKAQKNGIGYFTLINRVLNLKWDKERAVTEPVHTKGKHTGIRNRMEYDPKYLSAALKNGIKPSTFYKRINTYGWNLKKAATQPVRGGF